MEDVLVIGGGIGGLTAALALLRQGVSVRVFEQATAIGDVGAGISLGATASRGLYALGLEQALTEAADQPRGASAALHYRTGEPLDGAFKDRRWSLGSVGPTHVIHRADLFALLADEIRRIAPAALRLGHAFRKYEQDGEGVTVRFEGGRSARGAALIGCDGVRSAVRTQMFGAEHPRFTRQVAYRFLVPMERAAPFMTASPSGPYIGPSRSFTRYPIRAGSVVNCAAFVTSDAWAGEGWFERCSVEELQALFTGWHPDVQGLAAAAPPEGTAKWALYDRDPLEAWATGRVALLGDAAHPMLPFLGLGAAMAIEDAVVLARVFAETRDPAQALLRYQAARSPRAGLILLESRRQGETFRAGPDSCEQHTLTTHQERMAYDPATVQLP